MEKNLKKRKEKRREEVPLHSLPASPEEASCTE
jgi:hypothetical protein